ncbi:MAG: response regulator transcription factor [Butyrivibrio sp.]|uniref:LytR/AlgR family response regulator transcription factor n=1 Tax=Butyrivibrio sp. TaxID=28121 RepID=UPI001B28A814|nr:LytTR family DNA-binding domain-containing protein [Butyrivibrio sp.]MBO6239557.1 response regulator transcription factor [Butyrivibrio sp.]
MSVTKIAIVEDSQDDLKRFMDAFSSCYGDEMSRFELSTFGTGEEFLGQYKGQYDLIFLDIELPDTNGIELSKCVRVIDEQVVLVFITQMGQYAIHGYDVNATDYILKPLDEKIFSLKMKKIMRFVSKNQSTGETIILGNGKRILNSDAIIYTEVYKHDVTYHTTEGNFTMRSSLKDVETSLKGATFERISNSYLVNLKHIVGISGYELTLDNGEVLQISRSRRKELWDNLNRFLGGSL